jgi:hypothetical protein
MPTRRTSAQQGAASNSCAGRKPIEAAVAAGEELGDLRAWVRRYVSMVLEAEQNARAEEIRGQTTG